MRYEEPIAEIVLFDENDIICTSGNSGPIEGGKDD